MRAARLRGPGDIVVEDVEDPVPGPMDVVVDVRAAGICGSDLTSFTTGAYVGAHGILGHEVAGVVSAVGEAVMDVAIGLPVAVMPLGRCGTCDRCRRGRPQLCRSNVTDAIGYGHPGALADRVLVRRAVLDHNLHPLGEGFFTAGAMVEPLAVAMRAVGRARGEPGETALVLGLGMIGQCAARICAARGLKVFGVDRSALRRDLAGAAVPAGDFAASVDELAGPTGTPFRADVIIEASGATALIEAGLAALGAAGRLVIVSLPGTPAPVDTRRLALLEAEVLGSYGYDADFAEALRAVSDPALRFDQLVTGTFPLEDAARAFDVAADPEQQIKVHLLPAGASPF
jgi:threonine dehydrogenase-like Zn-dependent dehydrogenase